MQDLYVRFGLTPDFENEEEKFRNKIENLLKNGKFGKEIFSNNDADIIWIFNNHIGESHGEYYGSEVLKTNHILGDRLFNEYLYRLQVFLDILWGQRQDQADFLAMMIDNFFEESAINLGYFVKTYKTKAPQILPSNNEKQKEKIINAIDQLEAKPKKYKSVMEHFEEGIKELLTAKTKAQLKDVVEDMSTACDSLIKAVFMDENLGFKHLFKDNRWEQVKLNDSQKKIYSDLNQTIDKIKHDVIKTYAKEDVEIIVYLTGSFIEKVAK